MYSHSVCLCECTYAMYLPGACIRQGVRPSGAEVIDGCEPPCGCWEPNLGPLQEQQVLLRAEPSPQPPHFGFSRQGLAMQELKVSLQLLLSTLTYGIPPCPVSVQILTRLVTHRIPFCTGPTATLCPQHCPPAAQQAQSLAKMKHSLSSVSYTHLTLPTTSRV